MSFLIDIDMLFMPFRKKTTSPLYLTNCKYANYLYNFFFCKNEINKKRKTISRTVSTAVTAIRLLFV